MSRSKIYEEARLFIDPNHEIPITTKDLERLFGMYDRYFFANEIRDKLHQLGKTLTFVASNRASGLFGVEGRDAKGYYIDISANSISQSTNRVRMIMLLIEIQLIYLMMDIWGFSNKRPKELYGPNGSLFKCAFKNFFGYLPGPNHEFIETDLQRTSVNIPKRGYIYWENSCYIDSLLVTLLLNISGFWRSGMLNVDIDSYDYSAGFENCPKARMRSLAKDVQTELGTDLSNFIQDKREGQKCTNVRKLMAECLDLRPRGSWSTHNVADLYSTFAILFPDINMDIPFRVYSKIRPKEYTRGRLQYSRIAALTMWEFMEPFKLDSPLVKQNDWDLCRPYILVFTNGGIPRIKHFNDPNPEMVRVAFSKATVQIDKGNVFGPNILDGRYTIVGVIMLLGVGSEGGGSHYVAYFMGSAEKWYYYDDLSSNITSLIEGLPENVWHENSTEMPAMYFYQRV